MTYSPEDQICRLAPYTDQFTKERRFLKGVSPATLQWYKYSLQAFAPVLQIPHQSSMAFKAAVIERIEALTATGRGNKNVSVNTYLRCLKAFLKWAHESGIVKEPIKLSWLQEEEKILATLTADQLKKLLAAKPKTVNMRRVHLIVLTILDCGARIAELLTLNPEQVDWDNCSFRIQGKGNKQRLVPFSTELRKRLFLHVKEYPPKRFLFETRNGTSMSQRDCLRDLKKLARFVGITGIRFSAHTFRHCFAIHALRNGMDIYMVSRMLGHTDIQTTTVYLKSLGIEDIRPIHSKISVLNQMR